MALVIWLVLITPWNVAINRPEPIVPGEKSRRIMVSRAQFQAGADNTVATLREAMQKAVPGDTIAIESPTFFGILQIIESLGMRVCEIPTYPREGICLDELEKRLKCCRIKACVFTLNFSNPLGSCMPDAKKKKLVELLAQRDIPLIEDDVYGDLAKKLASSLFAIHGGEWF